MNIIGINASPRKKANTQTLVEKVLQGAAEKGAETRLVNLRDLAINGCLGCEGCKKHLGKCVQKDDLTPLLQELTTYDAIVMGTPVYWFHVTAQFKMLVDRLYSFMAFGKNRKPVHPPSSRHSRQERNLSSLSPVVTLIHRRFSRNFTTIWKNGSTWFR